MKRVNFDLSVSRLGKKLNPSVAYGPPAKRQIRYKPKQDFGVFGETHAGHETNSLEVQRGKKDKGFERDPIIAPRRPVFGFEAAKMAPEVRVAGFTELSKNMQSWGNEAINEFRAFMKTFAENPRRRIDEAELKAVANVQGVPVSAQDLGLEEKAYNISDLRGEFSKRKQLEWMVPLLTAYAAIKRAKENNYELANYPIVFKSKAGNQARLSVSQAIAVMAEARTSDPKGKTQYGLDLDNLTLEPIATNVTANASDLDIKGEHSPPLTPQGPTPPTPKGPNPPPPIFSPFGPKPPKPMPSPSPSPPMPRLEEEEEEKEEDEDIKGETTYADIERRLSSSFPLQPKGIEALIAGQIKREKKRRSIPGRVIDSAKKGVKKVIKALTPKGKQRRRSTRQTKEVDRYDPSESSSKRKRGKQAGKGYATVHGARGYGLKRIRKIY